jgi:hypothetical protein
MKGYSTLHSRENVTVPPNNVTVITYNFPAVRFIYPFHMAKEKR